MACLCGGTGRYRVAVYDVEHGRRIVSRACDCEAGQMWQFGIGMRGESDPPETREVPVFVDDSACQEIAKVGE